MVTTSAKKTTTLDSVKIREYIFIVRGVQVMIDSDLAGFYDITTGNLNKAALRNADRFPNDFRFQLTTEEYNTLIFQNGISKPSTARGGRRTLPYVYTEQGIAMLSAVLRSQTAVQMSIQIMKAFVEMRHFVNNHAGLFDRVSNIELKQLAYQQQTDKKFEEILAHIGTEKAPLQKLFYDGQIYDAFHLLTKLVQSANQKIILVDNYVNLDTLNVLVKKQANVKAYVVTSHVGNQLISLDVKRFNLQYPDLELICTNVFHDRFLLLDDSKLYHIGSSIKDAGKKCFGISLITDKLFLDVLLSKLNQLIP